MKPDGYWYILMGSLAGALAGVLVLWHRNRTQHTAPTPFRRLVVFIAGTSAIACALFAFRKAFGDLSFVNAPIAIILVTAWVSVGASVVPLPMPQSILNVHSRERVLLESRWSGVRKFGFLLRRTLLRHLGGRVYLSETDGDLQRALLGILAAEKLHLWALFGSVPWFAWWAIHGRWSSILYGLLVHVPLNVYPILHLRLSTGRIESCRARSRRPSRPMVRSTADFHAVDERCARGST